MKYVARSLADIAKHFQQMGDAVKKQLDELRGSSTAVKRGQRMKMIQLEATMMAFYEARDVVNSTELVKSGRPEAQQ